MSKLIGLGKESSDEITKEETLKMKMFLESIGVKTDSTQIFLFYRMHRDTPEKSSILYELLRNQNIDKDFKYFSEVSFINSEGQIRSLPMLPGVTPAEHILFTLINNIGLNYFIFKLKPFNAQDTNSFHIIPIIVRS